MKNNIRIFFSCIGVLIEGKGNSFQCQWLCLGGGNGMEWNEKNIFRIFFPPSCLRVLMEGMNFPFPCLRVQVGGNEMVKREYSFPPKPSKSQFFGPPKLGGIGENEFRFNENFIEIPKLPLESQPSVFSTKPAVPIFLLSLCCSFLTLLLITTSRTNIFTISLPLLSHAAANPNCEFFNCFDFIDLFTIKKFFNCFAFIVSIVFFFFFSFRSPVFGMLEQRTYYVSYVKQSCDMTILLSSL